MPGYSGTPLPKKLGIKPKQRVTFVGLPGDVRAELREALAECELARDGRDPIDFAMVFAREEAALKAEFARLAKLLAPGGHALGRVAEEGVWRGDRYERKRRAADRVSGRSCGCEGVRGVGGVVGVEVCATSEGSLNAVARN